VALAGLHRTLAAGEADAAALLAAQKVLGEMDRHDSIVVALRGERANFHALCTDLENGTIPLRMFLRPASSGGGQAITEHFDELQVAASVFPSHAWLLRHLTDVVVACKLPAVEQDARLNELQPKAGKMPVFARLLMPAWKKCQPTFRVDRAYLRCAMVALAVERYRLKRGAFPDDLTMLVPEFLVAVPADPYTDQPLKYRKTPHGISVFSVGPDHALRGDFFDGRRPVEGVNATAPRAGEFEFRLWDSKARLR
jgi:hypothetical protein